VKNKMNLRLIHTVTDERGRFASDHRRKVNSIVASYRGDDGHEYRKRFSSYDAPTVPEQGTHDELNALREQF
jgi:hypothetical protein